MYLFFTKTLIKYFQMNVFDADPRLCSDVAAEKEYFGSDLEIISDCVDSTLPN